MSEKITEEIQRMGKLMGIKEQFLEKTIQDFLKSLFKTKKTEDKKDKLEFIPGSDDNFYAEILKKIGAPVTKSNMEFMYAWRQAEGGKAKNNPFNTTWDLPGSSFYNCLKKDALGNCISGVRNYQSEMDGIEATVKTLNKNIYKGIVDSLKRGDSSFNTGQELKKSPWGTGPLVLKVLDGYASGYSPKPQPIA